MEVRRRIETVEHEPSKFCLKYLYLVDGRISEAVSKAYLTDKGTTPRGLKTRDLEFQEDDYGDEVALFKVKTAKRGGILRICGVPMKREYEPFTKGVAQYFQKFDKNDFVFPLTRQKVWRESRDAWKDLIYPIEDYDKIEVDKEGNPLIRENGSKVKTNINRHYRDFNLHAIRHIRATDLVVYYGFNGPNLSAFGGWTLSTAMRVSSSINRYVQLDWRSYYHKLLKKRW